MSVSIEFDVVVGTVAKRFEVLTSALQMEIESVMSSVRYTIQRRGWDYLLVALSTSLSMMFVRRQSRKVQQGSKIEIHLCVGVRQFTNQSLDTLARLSRGEEVFFSRASRSFPNRN